MKNLKKHNERLEVLVGKWNTKYRVGQKVHLQMDNGTTIETETLSDAVLVGGSAVCWFKGISGCYELERATPIGI